MSSTYLHTEKILLKQVSEGDQAAFARLFHDWHPLLYSYLYRLTESAPMAEEIVQDVFLKIWQTREALSEITSFKAWLFVISRNHALNALQKNMREILRHRTYEREYQATNAREDVPEENASLSLIDEAIDQLPPRRKEVYLLHRHQKLTYHQIADKLGIGRESVKTHLELAVKDITQYVLKRMSVALALLFFSK